MLAVQYLDGGDRRDLAVDEVRRRLRAAFERLPISTVAVGWGLSDQIVDACADETRRAGAELYRWHVLLAGDDALQPRQEWRAVGHDGAPVAGRGDGAAFTFVCPNRPGARSAVLAHLDAVAASGPWTGLMLDRMRLPSPAPDPAAALACFCDDCRRAAAGDGVDLAAARAALRSALATPSGRRSLVVRLLAPGGGHLADGPDDPLGQFLAFRARSVVRLIEAAAAVVRGRGRRLGLDCFSPGIAAMVGQDLSALAPHGDWLKIMSYGHTLGPAGLPFELADLADWLIRAGGTAEPEAMRLLRDATGLPLPDRVAALRSDGLTPDGLGDEARRARRLGVAPLLVGLELVDLKGVADLRREQILADLAAFRAAGVDGFVLSWDLWHIPPERLDLVARALGRAP